MRRAKLPVVLLSVMMPIAGAIDNNGALTTLAGFGKLTSVGRLGITYDKRLTKNSAFAHLRNIDRQLSLIKDARSKATAPED